MVVGFKVGATRPGGLFLWTVVKNRYKKIHSNIEASQSPAVEKRRVHQRGSSLLIQNVD